MCSEAALFVGGLHPTFYPPCKAASRRIFPRGINERATLKRCRAICRGAPASACREVIIKGRQKSGRP